MERILRILRKILWSVGFDFNHLMRNVTSWGWFLGDYFRLKKQMGANNDFHFGFPYPVFSERSSQSGEFSGHYLHQDLLVANKVFKSQPEKHVDIGSKISGFVTHVASFREIEVFDIRELKAKIKNVRFVQADLMALDPSLENYTDSISSLHVLEHFGLGRYKDPIDAEGHLKGLDNIYRMLKKGGKFYYSGPIGPQRINFNAHRVFSLEYLKNILLDKYQLDSFSYVDDGGELFEDQDLFAPQAKNNYGCTFGCGIFELTKK